MTTTLTCRLAACCAGLRVRRVPVLETRRSLRSWLARVWKRLNDTFRRWRDEDLELTATPTQLVRLAGRAIDVAVTHGSSR